MKSRWMKLAAVAMAVALAGGTFVYAKAQHGRHGPGGGGFLSERMFAHMEARLNLTPEQSQQVRGIFEAQRAKMKEQFTGGRGDREALMKAVFSDNPNQAEIQKQVTALERKHAQMLQQMVDTGLQVNKVLTPEQRAEFLKAMDEHRQAGERFRERMKQRKAERQGQTPQQ